MWNRTELYPQMKLYDNWRRNSKLTSLSGPLLRVIPSLICYWCTSRSCARTCLPYAWAEVCGVGFQFLLSFFNYVTRDILFMGPALLSLHFSPLSPCLHCCPLLFHVLWMVFSWEILPGDVSWCGTTPLWASLFRISATEWICLIV